MKAVGLLSGGLDSTLAAKLMLEQGIEVHAINFTSPFCTCTPKSASCAAAVKAVAALGGIPLKRVAMGEEYLKMVQNPQHGHGSGMNPCIDCRIMKIRKAVEFMREIGASFLFTGEVLGQRPMSQHLRALRLIDRESGVAGLIVRPLSAAGLEPTVPEKEGWIRREALLGLQGRSRKPQIALAEEKGINDYPCPAGGCLLTDAGFSQRLRDYFDHTPQPALADMRLLRTGRHIRLPNGDLVVVARDEAECELLLRIGRESDHVLAPVDFPGPVVLLRGGAVDEALRLMQRYTRQSVAYPRTLEVRYQLTTEHVVVAAPAVETVDGK